MTHLTPQASRRTLFVYRGTAADLLRLLAMARHPAGKKLHEGR